MSDKLLTPKEAAEFLSRSESCLKQWRAKGIGPRYVKLSERTLRYRESDLLAWIEAKTQGSEHYA